MSGLLFVGTLAGLLVIGAPLFLVIGAAAILSFLLFGDVETLAGLTPLVERIRSLADQQTLLAIPFFMLSGNIMAKGDIAKRLMQFARAFVGWLPGGMALSGIGACLIFAAVTGSSPATLVAIGGLVYPALMQEKYRESFSIGLVTSAGSLGILIPPSIPMIIYCLFNTGTSVEVEKLFLAGIGPGLLIAAGLGGYSMLSSARWGIRRYPFSFAELRLAARDGFWALMLPGLILGGIYSGIFTAVEAAAVSAVYAVIVEVYFHGGLRWRDLPEVFAETVTLLGSFIVIMVMAMGLADYFTDAGVPQLAADWIRSMNLSPFQFLLALNVLLLAVGTVMDILSALMVFVPLIAPIADTIGIDPIHLGIIFIVNLECGYLTPPVGLNLFLSATLFRKSFGEVVRYTMPFFLIMLTALLMVTWVPKVSLLLVEVVYDYVPRTPEAVDAARRARARRAERHEAEPAAAGKVKSMKELLDDADDEPEATPGDERGAEPGGDGVKSMKQLLDEASDDLDPADDPGGGPAP